MKRRRDMSLLRALGRALPSPWTWQHDPSTGGWRGVIADGSQAAAMVWREGARVVMRLALSFEPDLAACEALDHETLPAPPTRALVWTMQGDSAHAVASEGLAVARRFCDLVGVDVEERT